MISDFTFNVAVELFETGVSQGYEHLTVRDYLTADVLPDRFIIHRHDVDRKPGNALTMARLEARRGIPATYYFRTIEKTFQPAIIREIEDLGHEIGYHYEDLDRSNGDLDQAHKSFATELGRLRKVARIDTACMHGNPLTPYDNRDLWNGNRRFEDYELLGEAYLSMDFEDVTYFSDTGRTWEDGALKIKDHPVGGFTKRVQVKTTDELIDHLERVTVDRVCLLSHPNRWAHSRVEYISELAKDTVTNTGKRMIGHLR